MGEQEALRRAIKALKKACRDSDNFEHGNCTSWEVVGLVEEALKAEFTPQGPRARLRDPT